MSAIQVFQSPEFGQVRTTTYNGEIAFVAKDVVERLGIEWKGASGSLPHVPPEWKGVTSVQTPSGTQEMVVFTEQGLYFFLARSDKPLALPFQKWIAGEVLPSIRKTGQYALSSAQHIEQILNENAFMKQKMQLFMDGNYEKTYDFDEAAALLRIHRKPPFGQNHLKAYLANKGILCKAHYKNSKPIQKYLENGWFRPVVYTWQRKGSWQSETRYLLTNRGLFGKNGLVDMMVKEKLLHLPAPKSECFSFMSEPLLTEAGGTITIDNGIEIEMATTQPYTN